MRVGTKLSPLFLVAPPLEKKKVAASSLYSNSSESDWAIADLPNPASPYSQKRLASSSSLVIQSLITRIIPSRVDAAHRGGSNRAAESKAALVELCFRSSSFFSFHQIR
jgi:hypothetical protein